MHRKKTPTKKKRSPKKLAKATRTPESRPSAASDKRLSAFYATGPARPLAAPGPQEHVAKGDTPQAKKVVVGQPGDRFEREADAVAERTVAGQPAQEISRIPPGGLSSGTQRKEEESETQEAVQRQEDEAQEQEENTAQQVDEEAQEQEDEAQEQEEEPAQEMAGEEGEAQEQEEEPAQEMVQRQEEEPAQQTVQRQEEEAQEQDEEPAQETIQRQEEETQEKEEEAQEQEEEPAQEMAAEEGEAQQQEEETQEKEEEMQEKAASSRRSRKGAVAARAIQERGAGEPLAPGTRRPLEGSLGADLSGVRVHADGRSRQAAQDMGARAFTHKNHIWLGPGASTSDTKLMAHEATHVVQQGAARQRSGGAAFRGASAAGVQPKKASDAATKTPAPKGGDEEIAPEEVELKGQAEIELPEAVASWLAERPAGKGMVPVRFGSLAKGSVEMRSKGSKPRFTKSQAIPLQHELFDRIEEAAPELTPSLVVRRGPMVKGWVGLRAESKIPSPQDLTRRFKAAPDLLGLPGFDLSKLPGVTNRLEDGALTVGVKGAKISFGSLFEGTLSLAADDQRITTFQGQVSVQAQGLATGQLDLERDAKGEVTGEAEVDLELPKNFSGRLKVMWDGKQPSGKSEVGYQGEKLSGTVTLQLMDQQKAAELEAQKKAPAEGADKAAAPKGKKKAKESRYVIFGQGDLTFSFTDWLSGTAQVIVDPKGFVTIIGQITPQKEVELFPQKDYDKELFELEARAAYGLPVIGNVFIFANVSLGAFAKIGPAKLYKIQVDGTYSTDPEKSQRFSIQGTLNLSAAAGLRLRGEGGAGLEVLDHDVKAGAGVNALGGIRGYAEATPIIGYREKPAEPGVDKKGEFFIRGKVEIAGQPFLGLSGDLFVELDAPWWSPAPDKKWTWPLGSKEWPLGGTFGVGAEVDYVFGSGAAPAVKFQEADFSAEKFMTDLYSGGTKPKSKAAKKQGTWKEKNAKNAEPPPKEAKVGDVPPGKGGPPKTAKPPATVPKKKGRPASPDARTAEGKTVKQLKKEKAKKELEGKAKDKKAKAGAEDPKIRWEKGKAAVRQALDFARKKGIGKGELNTILKSIRRQKRYGFKTLAAREDPTDKDRWVVYGSMSPEDKILELKKWTETEIPKTRLDYQPGGDRTTVATAKPLSKKGKEGSETKRQAGFPKWWSDVERFPDKPDWRRIHLIHDWWGRGDESRNLVPGNTAANSGMLGFEKPMKKRTEDREVLWFRVRVDYRKPREDLTHGEYFPEELTATLGEYDETKSDGEGKTLQGPKPIPVKNPPKPGEKVIPAINTSGRPTLVGYGVPRTLVDWLTAEVKKRPFEGRDDLFGRIEEAEKAHPSFKEHKLVLGELLDEGELTVR